MNRWIVLGGVFILLLLVFMSKFFDYVSFLKVNSISSTVQFMKSCSILEVEGTIANEKGDNEDISIHKRYTDKKEVSKVVDMIFGQELVRDYDMSWRIYNGARLASAEHIAITAFKDTGLGSERVTIRLSCHLLILNERESYKFNANLSDIFPFQIDSHTDLQRQVSHNMESSAGNNSSRQ